MAVGRKTGGRAKGTTNKNTTALKDMIIKALTNVGGVKYLERQAEATPKSFMLLLGRVLPFQVTGAEGGPVLIVTGVDRGEG